MRPITEGLTMFTGMTVGRVYCIADPDGLTLIDASIAPSGPKIIRQIEASGRKASDVKRILITHAHPDHVGALPYLKARTGAKVIASAIERPVIEGKSPVPRTPREKLSGIARFLVPPNTKLKGTPVDREIGGGDVLSEVMGGLQVLSTPGHSPDHLSYWHPQRRILFCGDVIFNAPSPAPRLPFSFLTVDMDENKRSVGKLAGLDVSIVCFGHGEPLTQNAAQIIRDFARKVGALG